jgi:hypothetical protein
MSSRKKRFRVLAVVAGAAVEATTHRTDRSERSAQLECVTLGDYPASYSRDHCDKNGTELVCDSTGNKQHEDEAGGREQAGQLCAANEPRTVLKRLPSRQQLFLADIYRRRPIASESRRQFALSGPPCKRPDVDCSARGGTVTLRT